MSKPGRMITSYQSRMEWLPLDDLQIDRKTQATYNEARARAIAERFDPDLFGKPLAWAERGADGVERFYVLDGQHRVAAAIVALGKGQKIECEVVRGIDRVRASQLHLGRNMSRRPTAMDQFLVGLTAQDPECLCIAKVCGAQGFKIGPLVTDGTIGAVTAMKKIYRLQPPGARGQLLAEVLRILSSAWGNKSHAFRGELMLGMALVIKTYGASIEEKPLVHALKISEGPLNLLGDAKKLKSSLKQTIASAVSFKIVDIYNNRRRSGKVPSWIEARSRKGKANDGEAA